MAVLTDTGGITPADTLTATATGITPDFVTDDSAQQRPPAEAPSPPDFAQNIPVSALEDAKQQEQAQSWGQQKQAKIADLWGHFAQSQLDQMAQRITQAPDWQPPQPTVVDQPRKQPQAQPVNKQVNP